jgi:hypothetical protein
MRTSITSAISESDGRSLTNGSRRAEGESRASVLRTLLAKADAKTPEPPFVKRAWARLTGAEA